MPSIGYLATIFELAGVLMHQVAMIPKVHSVKMCGEDLYQQECRPK